MTSSEQIDRKIMNTEEIRKGNSGTPSKHWIDQIQEIKINKGNEGHCEGQEDMEKMGMSTIQRLKRQQDGGKNKKRIKVSKHFLWCTFVCVLYVFYDEYYYEVIRN